MTQGTRNTDKNRQRFGELLLELVMERLPVRGLLSNDLWNALFYCPFPMTNFSEATPHSVPPMPPPKASPTSSPCH